MSKQLCSECKALGYCGFERKADEIARSEAGKVGTVEEMIVRGQGKHVAIADERVKARDKGCPNVNTVDPDYSEKYVL